MLLLAGILLDMWRAIWFVIILCVIAAWSSKDKLAKAAETPQGKQVIEEVTKRIVEHFKKKK